MGEKAEKPEKPIVEPHLTGVEGWVHNAIREAYSHFGDGKDRNSAGREHRSLTTKALDFLQIIPYGVYYGSYQAAHAINWAGDKLEPVGALCPVDPKIAAKLLALPLAIPQALGLAQNEALSVGILATNNGKANLYEDIRGTVVPHFAWNNAPKVYLPGIHFDGKIDFEW